MNKGNNNLCNNRQILLSRRDALKGLSAGFGYMAFAGLASQAAAQPLARDSAQHQSLPAEADSLVGLTHGRGRAGVAHVRRARRATSRLGCGRCRRRGGRRRLGRERCYGHRGRRDATDARQRFPVVRLPWQRLEKARDAVVAAGEGVGVPAARVVAFELLS